MPAAANLPSLYVAVGEPVRPALKEANAWCQNFARRRAENFTVASWLLPRHLRQHFANIYCWCRWADDLADEAGDAQQRLRLLDNWHLQLHRCAAGEAEHPIYVALTQTLREFELPLVHFANLFSAFRQDQTQSSYETFDELLDYCRRSANPVGRLVLCLGRCDRAESGSLSDAICTGLQLVNFWQDMRRDWAERRRVYLPLDTLRRFDAAPQSIAGGVATDQLCAAIAFEVERAERFLRAGWPLVERVSPALRFEVELFIRGGLAVAAAIRRQKFDVLLRRPTIGKAKKLRLFAATVLRHKVLRRRGAPA